MRRIGSFWAIVIVSILFIAPGRAGSTETDLANPGIVAEVYEDGDMLLILESTGFESLPESRLFDLSGACPEKRAEVMRDFLHGKYDGVFLGTPGDNATTASDGGSLVECAREVKRVCGVMDSKADFVSIRDGCLGTCENVMRISVIRGQ